MADGRCIESRARNKQEQRLSQSLAAGDGDLASCRPPRSSVCLENWMGPPCTVHRAL